MLRDEMDNEVSICCFYAVIRNCHTPFHFLVSLGLFACMRFSLEQNCKHQTGIQLKFEAVTRGLLPPHGQEASGRYYDGPEHSSAVACCSLAFFSVLNFPSQWLFLWCQSVCTWVCSLSSIPNR